MSDVTAFKSYVREQLSDARANRVRPPVVACLWAASPHAQALHRERHGHAIAADEKTVLDTWSVQETPRLLRKHAGIGGAAVANLLEKVGLEAGWWYVEFQKWSLQVKGFETPFPAKGWGHALFDNLVFYDKLLDPVCRRCMKKAKGKGALHCHLHDGEKTIVCGTSVKDMTAAINLIAVADTHSLESLSLGGQGARLDLTDKDLALILRRLYEDRPEVVAEAIRALRKVSRKRSSWLTRVLDGTPSLRGLAEAVRELIEGK